MSVLIRVPGAVLGWIGRQGTRAMAALVVIGICVPWLGALLRPFVAEAVFILLCISFLRVDAVALRGYARRPALVIAATAWTSLAVPLLVAGGCHATGLDTRSPDLYLAVMLQAIASPMMAAPAFAALMGLDATLVLATLVSSTALIPFTAAGFAAFFLGPALEVASVALGLKLLALLVGSAALGFAIRRVVGIAAIQRQRERIDGLNVLVLLVFVAGLMQNVAERFLAGPLFALGVAALVFLLFFAVLAATTLLFLFAGRQRAIALGFMASQRNTGLMIAAVGGVLPEVTWLFMGLAQLPIYVSPQVLGPVVRRFAPGGTTARAPAL